MAKKTVEMKLFFSNKKFFFLLVLLSLLVVPLVINLKLEVPDSSSLNIPALPKDEADSFVQKASENYFFHEYPEAVENYRKAITIYETRNDYLKVAKTYQSIGDVYKITHHYDAATKEYLNSVEYHLKIGNLSGEAQAYKKIGQMHFDLKNKSKALTWYEKALDAVKNGPPNLTLGQVQETLGRFYWEEKQTPEAVKYISDAKATFTAIGFQMGIEHMKNILDLLQGTPSELHPHAMRSRRPEQNPS